MTEIQEYNGKLVVIRDDGPVEEGNRVTIWGTSTVVGPRDEKLYIKTNALVTVDE